MRARSITAATASGNPDSDAIGPVLVRFARDAIDCGGERPIGSGHAAPESFQVGRNGSGERRADEARLHQHHLNPKTRDFEPERVRQRLERVLGRVVDTAARKGQTTSHRADVDDPSLSPGAHAGQHQLRESDEAEHVGLELAADARNRDQFDRARLTVTGVVDENPDTSGLGHDRGHGCLHRRLVIDIQDEGAAARGPEGGQRTQGARGCVYPPSGAGEAECCRMPDSRGTAGDQDDAGDVDG